jgi:hypothetical protein
MRPLACHAAMCTKFLDFSKLGIKPPPYPLAASFKRSSAALASTLRI